MSIFIHWYGHIFTVIAKDVDKSKQSKGILESMYPRCIALEDYNIPKKRQKYFISMHYHHHLVWHKSCPLYGCNMQSRASSGDS